jgi:hypothetical protein
MGRRKTSFLLWVVATLLVTVTFAVAAGATTDQIIYAFQGGSDGFYPESALVADAAGNLYGTTLTGGGNDYCSPFGEACGVVFELSPKSGGGWTERVIHAFAGGTDGGLPYNGVVLDSKGNVYGTTYLGGTAAGGCFSSGGCGKIYKLTPPKKKGQPWKETTLYSFCSLSNCTDGAYPTDVLTIDAKGNLYGTTNVGGLPGGCNTNGFGGYGCGVTFRVGPGGKETVLYTFNGSSDGGFPSGGVILDPSGHIYGTTNSYGTGDGVVYELTLSKKVWNEKVLYTFTGGADGSGPTTPLLLDAAGNLYGTTPAGGTYNYGSAFELTPVKKRWKEKTLYDFTGGADGGTPYASLVPQGGSFYGTTYAGGTGTGCGFAGTSPCGTVFALTPNKSGKWKESVVYSFQAGTTDGALPENTVYFDNKGNLFGTTMGGGDHGVYGVVYEIAP